MDSFQQVTAIGERHIRIEGPVDGHSNVRWHRARDAQLQVCHLCLIPVSPSLNVDEALAALPLAMRINSPHVQTLLAADHHAGQPGQLRALVREAPNHTTLRTEIDRGQIPEARVRLVLIQLSKAIAARAAFPFGHGCLAPESVLVEANGDIRLIHPWLMWLLDATHRDHTTGTSNWEYTWLAPECIQQHSVTDLISDCYSACALAFAMLTGRTHVDADSALVLDSDLGIQAAPRVRDFRPDCSSTFAALLQRGLHPIRGERPQSPGELLAALEALPPLAQTDFGYAASFTADLGDLGNLTDFDEPPFARGTTTAHALSRPSSHGRLPHARTTATRHRVGSNGRTRAAGSQPIAVILGLIGGVVLLIITVIGLIVTRPSAPPFTPTPVTTIPPTSSTSSPTASTPPTALTISRLPPPAEIEPDQMTAHDESPDAFMTVPGQPHAPSTAISNPASATPTASHNQNDTQSAQLQPETNTIESTVTAEPEPVAPVMSKPDPALVSQPAIAHVWPSDAAAWRVDREAAAQVLSDLHSGSPFDSAAINQLNEPWSSWFSHMLTAQLTLIDALIANQQRLVKMKCDPRGNGQRLTLVGLDSDVIHLETLDQGAQFKLPWNRVVMAAQLELGQSISTRLDTNAHNALTLIEELLSEGKHEKKQFPQVWAGLYETEDIEIIEPLPAQILTQSTPGSHQPLQQIVLLPRHGDDSEAGDTWRLRQGGQAIDESMWQSKSQPYDNWRERTDQRLELPNLDTITFTFEAELGVPYHYWIRGQCTARSRRELRWHDAIMIRFDTPVTWTDRPYTGGTRPIWPGLARVNGFGLFDEWGWLSAQGEGLVDEPRDRDQTTVIFTQPGPQRLSILLDEGPMCFDCIWLSQTQGTRPDPTFNPLTLE